MAITLPLEKMSVEEKIGTMEALWDDLCKTPGNVESPEWHEDILQEREEALNAGKDSFIDWEEAKKKIGDSIR